MQTNVFTQNIVETKNADTIRQTNKEGGEGLRSENWLAAFEWNYNVKKRYLKRYATNRILLMHNV